MANAKLSGSLLVYKDLPSATGAASPGNEGDRRGSPIHRFSIALCAVVVPTTAGLLLFMHANGQSMPTERPATPPSAEATLAAPPAEPAAKPELTTASAVEPVADPAPIVVSAAAQPTTIDVPSVPVAAEQPPPAVAAAPVSPPPEPVAADPAPTRSAGPRLSKEELAALLARGDALLRNRDIASARLVYQRAAEGGDAQAALRLGETHDAAFLARAGLSGVRGDATAAAEWYRLALTLGAVEAEILLTGVAPAGGEPPGGKRPQIE